MRRQPGWQGGLAGCTLGLALLCGPGCLTCLHAIEPAQEDCTAHCLAVPDCCKDHVYIFLINGLDPLEYGNLRGVRSHLQALGFSQTYYAQLYHGHSIKKEVRRLHEEDPEARFVLIGFSFGANLARWVTRQVQEAGISIDMLVYISGNTMRNIPRDRPDNAGMIVNITASELLRNGAKLDDAENDQLKNARHFGAPTHPDTLRALERGLATVAERVPMMEQVVEVEVDSTVPVPIEEPTPRPTAPQSIGRRDEWDFLKPVSRLDSPRPAERHNLPAVASQQSVAAKR